MTGTTHTPHDQPIVPDRVAGQSTAPGSGADPGFDATSASSGAEAH